jgi:superoxide dismutase, Cu-Zn family
LPNLNIGSDGSGRLETATEQITLGSGATSVWDADGSALVVHAAPDDFKTDPTGNSGARVACGVITKAAK